MDCNLLDCPVLGNPRQETEMGGHFLLQGIFLTQGLNLYLLSLLYWQADSLPLIPVTAPVSPRNGTEVLKIAGHVLIISHLQISYTSLFN